MGDGTKLDPYIKDPDSVRTFGIEWAGFLQGLPFAPSGGSVWAVMQGDVVIVSDTVSGTVSLAQLSGGTLNENCALRNRATRSDGEMDDQTIYVNIREK